MAAFAEGYSFFEKNAGTYAAAELGSRYVQDVENEISKIVHSLNENLKGNQSGAEQLKGFVAEHWHAGTFNINSVVKGASVKKDGQFIPRAKVLGSNKFASPDIQIDSKINASSKFYKTPAQTLRQQAKTAEETYKQYVSDGGAASFEEYLKERNITDQKAPIYQGQIRLVPKEQLEIIKKLGENLSVEDKERYAETLRRIDDRIKDGQGVESIPLDTENATEIANMLRENGATEEHLAEMGLTSNALIGVADIIRQAFKAGISAAIITVVLKTVPEIYKAVSELVRNGELDFDQFKQVGFSAVTGAGEGFINGSLAAAITAACQKGLLGAAFQGINPSVIGAATVIAMTTLKKSLLVARGDLTRVELANDLVRDIFISACSIGHGLALEAALSFTPITVLGFMIGSFIGSLLGSFVYDLANTAMISFCIDTGFTMFGLVEQNYELPDEVFECIGAEVFKYEEFSFEKFIYEEFSFEEFTAEQFMPEEISISLLRRGVIGIHKIGYIS